MERAMKFEPEQKSVSAPYFEDISSDEGFKGFSTQKSIKKLETEVTDAISKLGGFIVSIQRGKFTDEKIRSRFGYVFVFNIPGPGNQGTVLAEIKIAALPLRKYTPAKEEQTKKMALYIVRDWLEDMFNFQRLTPAPVATLIPFMIGKDGDTLSDSYLSGSITGGLLMDGKHAAPDSGMEEIIEGEISK
jgi:hypothetical protein